MNSVNDQSGKIMQEKNRTYSLDTHSESAVRQAEILRSIGLAGRAEMTFQLSDNVRAITINGIHSRHPEYTPQQVTEALFRLTLDAELFRQIFPHSEIVP